jgi:hypothetical protein
VTAQVQGSNISKFTGGGLIFGLIDGAIIAKRTAEMAEIIKPLQEQTADFNFRNKLESALSESAVALHLPTAKVGGVLVTLTADERKQLFEINAENAILQIQTVYWLTMDYKRLMVGTTAYLWVRGNDTPVFYNNYAYYTPPVSDSSDTAEIVKKWSENKGEKLRLKLIEGISETIKIIKRDLSQQQDSVIASTTPPLWSISSQNKLTFTSYLEKDGNRYILRKPNGSLESLSSDDSI